MQSENTAEADNLDTGVSDVTPDLQSLGELLAQDEPGEAPGGDEGESSGSTKKTKPTKFNDLAGTLEMDLDALYKLEIASSDDGEAVTIEQLKDQHSKVAEFELSKLEFEESKSQQEQELMRAQGELQEILQALPKNAVKPEVLQKIRARSEATTKLERKETLRVIPDWKNETTREADIAGMTEHLQGYGYPIGYLANVVDHRQLKFIRDSWQREQRIQKALAAVKSGKPAKSAATTKQKKAPSKTAVTGIKPRKGQNKLEAVFSNVE
jgi:hypothetical protein